MAIFRCLIEPCNVYAKGVTEWEALDEIKNIHSPNQMLWSLIYRKLKGNRGNTMITIYESERLIKLIRDKNSRNILKSENFSFNLNTQEIIASNCKQEYTGRKKPINILPRMFQKFYKNNQFEAHLQAYILQNFYQTKLFGILDDENIEWLGNEVSCGVGMQRIDIMVSISENSINPRKIIPIELKSTCVHSSILTQIQRYVDWLEQYYTPNRCCDIAPMIICRQTNKDSKEYKDFVCKSADFNQRNNILAISYIEFRIRDNEITFERIF